MTLNVRQLVRSELDAAADVLGRGMRDNPINIAAFGASAHHRQRALARFFRPALRGLYRRGEILGAFGEEILSGVCGMAPPGRCQPTLRDKLSVLPGLLIGNSPQVPLRVLSWTGAWSSRDPGEPHWHLGPVAVDVHLQGQGIGSQLLAAFCANVDRQRSIAYLETDKPENVRFYEKFGFAVVAEALVLGIPNWFMHRARASQP
jgi:ribosomal protein S18 acetylase RimI-like enzyme